MQEVITTKKFIKHYNEPLLQSILSSNIANSDWFVIILNGSIGVRPFNESEYKQDPSLRFVRKVRSCTTCQ